MWEKERELLLREIVQMSGERDFTQIALRLFRLQSRYNPVYSGYIQLLRINPEFLQSLEEIPFLPVELFKEQTVRTGNFEPQITFQSSSTTGQKSSLHGIRDIELYHTSFRSTFERFYGNPAEWSIMALLPSYLERNGSSLVYMAADLINRSKQAGSGFYLNNYADLANALAYNEQHGQKTLLLGVTFALLDFAEYAPMSLKNTVIMETGGMKGRRKELIREEVHQRLSAAFQITGAIHSEYGMTELLSQAYSSGSGKFRCPPWMKVLVRDSTDPMSVRLGPGKGGLNVIDLMNIDSCAFLATGDLVVLSNDGSFSVEGRFDRSDVRGCNLMIA